MNGSAPSRRLRQTFAANASSVRDAREFVSSALAREPLDDVVVSNLRLVVSELVSNVVQHGDADRIVEVTVDLSDAAWLELAVTGGVDEPVTWSDPERWSVAPPADASGRGLGIVRTLVDDLRTDHVDGVVSVHCRVRR